MEKLKGKVALITGSDSGIGQATAIEFAKEGADVVICYHSDKEGAEETLKEVEKLNRKGIVLQVDISDEQNVAQLFEQAFEKFGTLDILVNNAAVNGSGIHVADMSTEVFDKTIRTNLYGTFFCSRTFIRHRKQKGGKGKIINVSSVHEEIVSAGTADYCASKAGVRNLARTMALELAEDGINVNNIAPGMILTPMNQEAVDDKEARQKSEKNIPMKRAGKPEEIAKVAVFLASSDSDYVTGSSYFMDGGLSQHVGQGA
ncbi:SDR family NAD(P)-dependent oxidoreductase [Pontibacter arcticus]|uniref:Short-chain dehydrogenase n=1 Tax=Pontibacter arcticus TaxID=2080288 RepID=A0A364RJ03_9BACT|nr:SDR family oxidoreductase [Pontibacter arcticus]RAU84272.1 short-chain dehydrogenase [Pontibacter arcticus]